MQLVRIWFTKQGRAKYISHLDLMRSMTKAVRRSGLKIWYTEGFNPRPYMSFPLPLSLGIESKRECMDMKIEETIGLEEITEKFKGVMPEGLEVFETTLPFNDAKEIMYARYIISLDFNSAKDADTFAKACNEAVFNGHLIGEKKGKQGRRKVMKEICLNDHIFNCKIEADNESVVIRTDLSAGSTANINPQLLMTALEKEIGINPIYKKYEKTALLTGNFEEFR